MTRWTLLLAFGGLALVEPARADPIADAQATLSKPLDGAAKAGHRVSFVAMPIPIANPAIGNGLGVGAMALYTPTGSPRPWTTGIGGLYTDTKSWGVAAFQKAYVAEDRFRVTAGGGGGVFNVKYYGIGADAGSNGRYIDMEQDAVGGIVEGLMRVNPKVHVGLRYRGARMRTKIDLPDLPNFPEFVPPEIQLRSQVSQLGLSAEYDSRDNEYNPGRGLYAHGQWMLADEVIGSDFDYDLLNASLNGYHRIDDRSVIAWRGSVCRAGDGAPFYDICNFGANNDLRGYPAGQFRDRAMFAVQAEYRRHLFWRLGGTAFVGVGEVASDFSEMGKELLPAAGLGLRFEASKKYRVNASIDFAVGDHVSAAYFYIGEAF